MKKYMLIDGNIVETDDLLEWAKWYENFENWRIARDEIGGVTVSTVFLGIDHGWESGEPILFETMVFRKDGSDSDCRRYTSKEEAIHGHNEIVRSIGGEA